jgi:hypothetical protein
MMNANIAATGSSTDPRAQSEDSPRGTGENPSAAPASRDTRGVAGVDRRDAHPRKLRHSSTRNGPIVLPDPQGRRATSRGLSFAA